MRETEAPAISESGPANSYSLTLSVPGLRAQGLAALGGRSQAAAAGTHPAHRRRRGNPSRAAAAAVLAGRTAPGLREPGRDARAQAALGQPAGCRASAAAGPRTAGRRRPRRADCGCGCHQGCDPRRTGSGSWSGRTPAACGAGSQETRETGK